MTDRQPTDNAPLFQNMDEQEQVYAPQQVPGSAMSGDSADRSGAITSGAGTDDASGMPGVPGSNLTGGSAGGLVGGGGAAPIAPLIPTTQRGNANQDADTDDTTLR